ncbi:SOS response-associated peptidase [Maribacter sp. 2307ULW6-5]|uniref:SOS response-associated peptidase n=1 Tax=Maribacter sp. 2307ULW6-5 TaxID=3386275 RepID=UPI0039BCED43
MCYSTRQTRKKEALQQRLQLESALKDQASDLELVHYHANGWNHPIMWMVAQEHPNMLLPAMWGLMPSHLEQAAHKDYFKNPRTFGGLNAQSEKLFGHFIYKHSWERRRCVIPVDGFFEPHNTQVKVKGKDFKVPFYFHHGESEPLFLAGIYTQTADERWTFTILTKAATPKFAQIHNDKKRRPVIIPEKNIGHWLRPDLTPEAVRQLMDRDEDEARLNAYPVSKDLYSRTVDSNRPDIIEKKEYREVDPSFQ